MALPRLASTAWGLHGDNEVKHPANLLRSCGRRCADIPQSVARRRGRRFVFASRTICEPCRDTAGAGLGDGRGVSAQQRQRIRWRGGIEGNNGRQNPCECDVNLNLSLSGQGDLVVLSPTYTFATPVLGGQFSLGVASWFGKSSASIAGTLTATVGPLTATRSGVLADSLTSYGDVVPTATLRWNQGVNNYMVYVTGDIPAGDYDPTRLANLGIGHGTIDAGGAYTYLNPTSGNEFSATAGFTYNFKNPDTQYRNCIDFHFDWGAAHFVSKQVFIGVAGYAYQQLTDDSGPMAISMLLTGRRAGAAG
jgi:hypothetical protein